MLYKHSFSVLCGHLNLNQKKKKIEFGRLPVKPTGKPVKLAGIPVRTSCTAKFEFKFEFHRYRSVYGQTEPVYWYRTALVWPHRSVSKTLRGRGTTAAQAGTFVPVSGLSWGRCSSAFGPFPISSS